jgi:hypothetical protein
MTGLQTLGVDVRHPILSKKAFKNGRICDLSTSA